MADSFRKAVKEQKLSDAIAQIPEMAAVFDPPAGWRLVGLIPQAALRIIDDPMDEKNAPSRETVERWAEEITLPEVSQLPMRIGGGVQEAVTDGAQKARIAQLEAEVARLQALVPQEPQPPADPMRNALRHSV